MRKLSINVYFGYSMPIEARLALIKAAGFDEVVLFWGEKLPDFDGNRHSHPDLVRRNGLSIENIHAPIGQGNLFWLEGDESDEYERKMLGCISDCHEYGIPATVFHITEVNPPPFNQTGLDRIKRIVDFAEKNNINMALENIWHLDYLDYLFSGIRSDRLGFCYDSGHENCFTRDSDLLARYGSRLKVVHLHDNDGRKDQHGIPGTGTIDWVNLIARLGATGYDGSFALELSSGSKEPVDDSESLVFLEKAYIVGKTLSMNLDTAVGAGEV